MLLDVVTRFVDTYLPKEWVRVQYLTNSFVSIGSFLFLLYILYQVFRFAKCICLGFSLILSPRLLSSSWKELEKMLRRMGYGDWSD